MAFFQKVEGDAAIIVENGVYKQVDLYTRDGMLYVQSGGGFIRLFADGSTTKAKTRLDFMSFDHGLFKDSLVFPFALSAEHLISVPPNRPGVAHRGFVGGLHELGMTCSMGDIKQWISSELRRNL